MKAISIRQPWAWAITNGHKDIENRNWTTRVTGYIYIHASKGCTKAEYDDAVWEINKINPNLKIPALKDLERGGLVGTCTITGCVEKSSSPWFFGRYGFTIENASRMNMIPYKGQLGFFEVDPNKFTTWPQTLLHTKKASS